MIWNARRFGATPNTLRDRLLSQHKSNGYFLSSQPKSGTHLLERILCLMPGIFCPIIPTLNEENIGKYGGWEKAVDNIKSGQFPVLRALNLDQGKRMNGKQFFHHSKFNE